jgi:alkyl sulfatase BDS1-like metallo-beta-lactamase superfamily hydrolase
MIEIAEMIELPESLATEFFNRGYYGSVNHDVKAVYQRYLGWFDGNPANLHSLPPKEASEKYVEFMGGADAVLSKAREAFGKGEYRWVAQVVNHVVFAEPNNKVARKLQADALEQLGYQAESGPWRNFYLSGAKELRDGVQEAATPDTASPDFVRAMPLDLYFDYLSIRVNGPKAAGKAYTFNADFTDTDQKYLLELSNGVLNYSANEQTENPDATVHISRKTLDDIALGLATFAQKVDAGEARVEGNRAAWEDFLSTLDTFEFWFNIVTP